MQSRLTAAEAAPAALTTERDTLSARIAELEGTVQKYAEADTFRAAGVFDEGAVNVLRTMHAATGADKPLADWLANEATKNPYLATMLKPAADAPAPGSPPTAPTPSPDAPTPPRIPATQPNSLPPVHRPTSVKDAVAQAEALTAEGKFAEARKVLLDHASGVHG